MFRGLIPDVPTIPRVAEGVEEDIPTLPLEATVNNVEPVDDAIVSRFFVEVPCINREVVF